MRRPDPNDSDERTEEPRNELSRSQEDDEYPEEGPREPVEDDREFRSRRAAALLADRYGVDLDEIEQEEEEQEVQAAPVPAAAAPVVPPAPTPDTNKRPAPNFQRGGLSEEEEAAADARLQSLLEAFDYAGAAREMRLTAKLIAARETAAATANLMATQVHTSADPDEAMFLANLHTMAQQNPAILQNPAQVEAVRYLAAVQSALESGDPTAVHAAIRKTLDRRNPQAPPVTPAPAAQQERKQQAPAQPQPQAVPTGGAGGRPSGTRRGRPSNQDMGKDFMPYASEDDLEAIYGGRR